MSDSKYDRIDENNIPAPQWTPTQPGETYMIRADGAEPAQVPGQRVVGRVRDDRHRRRVVEVSVPHLPYERWIDTAGNIKQLPIRTTRCMTNKTRDGRLISADDSSFIEQTRRQHWRAGWLSFEAGAYGEDRAHWLARRDAEIAERRDGQAQDMSEATSRFADAMKRPDSEEARGVGEMAASQRDAQADRQRRQARRAELEGTDK